MGGLLEARDLRKNYSRATSLLAGNGSGSRFAAVDGVSFSVAAGESLLLCECERAGKEKTECGKTEGFSRAGRSVPRPCWLV